MLSLPPEFALLAACCRWPPSDSASDEIRRLSAGVEWEAFLAFARRHRVEGLAHRALRRSAIENPVNDRLAAIAAEMARESLVQGAEAFRLHCLLDDAGMPHLFVKGATLARLAYGTLALKRSLDIDVLVLAKDYRAACALLAGEGYRCVYPGALPDDAILRHAEREKDSAWQHPDTKIIVELHLRLTNNPVMLTSITARSPAREVEIAPGMTLPTLREDELFAYLCAHGALSGWYRLKWAADVAALLGGASAEEVERLYRDALRIAPGRSAGQALLLCNRLLATPLTEGLAAELRADSTLARLVDSALGSMLLGGPHGQLRKQRFGTARVHLATFFLRRGWRYKASELRRQLGRIRVR